MARGVNLSVMGLYHYDNTLFDNLVLPTSVDSSKLIPNILMECAGLEVIYPDFDIMKESIGYWSQKNLTNWEQMMAALVHTGYDPFVNINRTETTSEYVISDNTNKVSAYDESTFTNRENNAGTLQRAVTFNVSGDSALSDSQDLVRKETELRLDYNIYDIITEQFKQAFCLLVY